MLKAHTPSTLAVLSCNSPSSTDSMTPRGSAAFHIARGSSSMRNAMWSSINRASIGNFGSVDFLHEINTPMSVPTQNTNIKICRYFQLRYASIKLLPLRGCPPFWLGAGWEF